MKRQFTISFLIFALLLQLACNNSLIRRISKAVKALPAVVRVVQPDATKNRLAIEGLAVFSTALDEFVESGSNAFKWQKVLDVWEDLQRRNVFNLSAQNQERINAIVAVITALLDQVLIPTGLPGSGGGAFYGTDKVVFRIEESKVKELERLIKGQ